MMPGEYYDYMAPVKRDPLDISKYTTSTGVIRIPVNREMQEHSEGGWDGTYTNVLPNGELVPSNLVVRQDPQGNYYAEPKFYRGNLDATGQKIFDQLKQQREAIEKQVGVDEAKKYYSDLTGLTKDETTALMAMELQSTGITDIYKVRKDESTERMPVRWGEVEAAGEGAAREGYYYIDPVKGLVEVGRNEGQQGYIDIPRVSYVNTDTGQVINPNAGGPFSGREGILSDYSVARRRDIGTGVQFSPEGIPIYFSQGEATPSSWKRFTNSIRPLLPLAAMLIPGIGQALQPLASSILGAGASQAAVGALAQGIASGVANTIATGEIGEGLKAGILSGGLGYGLQSAQGLGDIAYSAPEATVGGLTLGEINAAAAGEAIPNFAGLDAGLGVYDVSNLRPDYSLYDAKPFVPDMDYGYGLGDPIRLSDLGFLTGNAAPPDLSNFGEYGPDFTGPPGPAAPQNYVDDLFSGAGAPTLDVAYPEVLPPTLPTPDYVDDLFSGAGAPTPDVVYPDLVAPPTLPTPEWDTGYPTKPEVPLGSLEPTTAPFDITDVVPDSSLGDPTGAYGGMPSGPGYFDPASAMETQFDLPNAGAGIGIPAALAALGADAKAFLGTTAGRLLASTLLTAAASKAAGGGGGGGGSGPQGWSGDIPKFQAVRERVPLSDAGRRPGEYGRRYFSDTAYVPLKSGESNLGANIENVAAAQGLAQLQAQELAKPPVKPPVEAAAGGLMGLAKGRYLNGTTDGMEDEVPADIDGKQPARLSHGEFVIPADVVSHLGNGNSQAGAKRLYEMMDKIRHARTGTKKQGKQINADKYLPV